MYKKLKTSIHIIEITNNQQINSKMTTAIYTINVSDLENPSIKLSTTLKTDPTSPDKYDELASPMLPAVRYTVATYDQSTITPELSKYRSVVFVETEDLNVPIGFSLPRSIPSEQFIARNPMVMCNLPDNVVVVEHIEGTMINLFYDPINKWWDISTKTRFGASVGYYTDSIHTCPTFHKMFLDAIGLHRLNDWKLLGQLNKQWSYSFVLQHPDNHIALPIVIPNLYLVAVFEKIKIEDVYAFQYVPQSTFQHSITGLPPFQFPDVYGKEQILNRFSAHDEMFTYYVSRISEYGFPGGGAALHFDYANMQRYFETYSNQVGVMLINTVTGDRTKFTNKQYLALREIRGNQPNLRYLCYDLLRTHETSTFMFHFPRYNEKFLVFYSELLEYTACVYEMYKNRFITKTTYGQPIPPVYNQIVRKIRSDLYTQGKLLYQSDVLELLVNQPQGALFGLMKRHLDHKQDCATSIMAYEDEESRGVPPRTIEQRRADYMSSRYMHIA
jgi:hypothetical protein